MSIATKLGKMVIYLDATVSIVTKLATVSIVTKLGQMVIYLDSKFRLS